MLPENYYERNNERSRLRYHQMKEQYKEKYQERRDKCVAYMKRYNKEYYQDNREEILEKNKAYGNETRRIAEYKNRKPYTEPAAEPIIVKVDPAIFTILFDD